MLIFNKHLPDNSIPNFSVSLPFDKRARGRLRIALEQNGADAGIHIERGDLLRDGSKLGTGSGQVLEVNAQPEPVSVATTSSRLLFARACYHVGNRHTQVQIGEQELIYLHDHVLDDMLRLLGLTVRTEQRAFEPEAGAYTGAHAHAHETENEVIRIDHDYSVPGDLA